VSQRDQHRLALNVTSAPKVSSARATRRDAVSIRTGELQTVNQKADVTITPLSFPKFPDRILMPFFVDLGETVRSDKPGRRRIGGRSTALG